VSRDALGAETVAELWRHARALAERGAREHSPPQVRRALVMLAVAGSGGDAAGFEQEVVAVHRGLRLLGLDPVPLFDAASALLPEDDHAARGVMVTLPRREVPPPRRPGMLG
jgi:hypothetical protein